MSLLGHLLKRQVLALSCLPKPLSDCQRPACAEVSLMS